MQIDVGKLLSSGTLAKLSVAEVKSINEAIKSEIDSNVAIIESDTRQRFDAMVEGISARFDATVTNTITESVSSKLGDGSVNKKMLSVITDMVSVLENAGIDATEHSKELKVKIKLANEKLEDAYKEREVLKDQLDDADKENYILSRLVGSKAEVVSAALEFFKDKDLLDVQDEIDAFADGDFSDIISGDDNIYDDGLNDVTLDQVSDVLDGIHSDHTSRISKNKVAQFESLGRGLHPQKGLAITSTPDITDAALLESTFTSDADPEYDGDTGDALSQIDGYKNLGWRYQ